METEQTEQIFEETTTEETRKLILTISTIAFDFDFVTSDPSRSRADEIKVLLVKNKKPSRKSKEGKPGGFGLPTGQVESREAILHAVERETEDESGCSVKKIIGKLFVIKKTLKIPGKENPENLPNHLNYESVPNEIHVFLESMIYNPEEELVDGEAIKRWLEPNRQALYSAMSDLRKSGLLENFITPDEAQE